MESLAIKLSSQYGHRKQPPTRVLDHFCSEIGKKTNMNLRNVPAVGILLLLPLNLYAQNSQPKNEITLRSVVRKGLDLTYFELLRMLLPDLQVDSTEGNAAIAHRTIPFRNIEAKEVQSLKGDFNVTTFGARSIKSDGRRSNVHGNSALQFNAGSWQVSKHRCEGKGQERCGRRGMQSQNTRVHQVL